MHIPTLTAAMNLGLGSLRSLACAPLAALAFVPVAYASVVQSPVASVVVPATTAGLYINVVTGATAASPNAVSGWDINPWGSGSLFIYRAATGGGIVSSPNSHVASLAVGATVDAASTYAQGMATFGTLTDQWTLNQLNYFGFKFTGDDALLHYGFGEMFVGATALNRTLGDVFYESTADTGITVSADPLQSSAVPEPTSLAMVLAGLVAAGAVPRRRAARAGQPV